MHLQITENCLAKLTSTQLSYMFCQTHRNDITTLVVDLLEDSLESGFLYPSRCRFARITRKTTLEMPEKQSNNLQTC